MMHTPRTVRARAISLRVGCVLGVLLLVGSLAGATAVRAASSYSITNLGTLGGTRGGVAWAVNEKGQVVGHSFIAGDTEIHAFSWTAQGGMVDLGTLGGPFSRALAVNNKGQVVGTSMVNDDVLYPVYYPVLWEENRGQ